ncbi:MAG: ABC transporter substrate-binding protein [Rikenellaceae bacterium]|nr:ABC transporter substrate-binding protein [Rikenellaceae bacterium]
MKRLFVILLGALTLAGCGSGRADLFSLDAYDRIYTPSRAGGFDLYACGRSTILQVREPWQGARGVEMLYFLSRGGEKAPDGFPGIVVEVPLRRVICMSSTYVALLDTLGRDSCIVGVSGVQYISNPLIQSRFSRGEVRDVGYESGLNYELLTELAPDVLFIYGVQGENSLVTDKVRELGVKVVYVGDYLENSPLGKAEWLVATGEFFDRRPQAAAIYADIEKEYEEVRQLAQAAVSRPGVMLNAPWRDAWFVPGDRSYIVRLIDDAGGDYVCRGDDSDRSRPISSEEAYILASKAQFWLSPGSANSLAEVMALNPKFGNIPAVRQGHVYNNNARQTPMGGSDFWESGTVAPQMVLKDLVRILHPELLPDHELYYFKRLE